MSRPVRRNKKNPAIVILIVACVFGFRYYQSLQAPEEPTFSNSENLPEEIYRVKRVVDGDTLLLENGARVRLQGIDSPESVKPDHPVEPWGKEASQFTKEQVEKNGMQVRLQFGRERKDQYDRFLAFVWLEDRLLNEELVRAGLARAKTHYRYSQAMKRRLVAAQKEAQADEVGIWSK